MREQRQPQYQTGLLFFACICHFLHTPISNPQNTFILPLPQPRYSIPKFPLLCSRCPERKGSISINPTNKQTSKQANKPTSKQVNDHTSKSACRRAACGYRTMPCQTMPCQTRPYQNMPCQTMPCHAMPCHARPCQTMPCHARPCPHHAMPCQTMPCYQVVPVLELCELVTKPLDLGLRFPHEILLLKEVLS